jgi:hypothetical protein
VDLLTCPASEQVRGVSSPPVASTPCQLPEQVGVVTSGCFNTLLAPERGKVSSVAALNTLPASEAGRGVVNTDNALPCQLQWEGSREQWQLYYTNLEAGGRCR